MVPFYQRKGPVLFCKVAGLFAGAMMLAAPFFHWRIVWVKSDVRVREGFSLFDVVRHAFSSDFTGRRWMRVMIVAMFLLVILTALWVLYFAFRDQIYPDKVRNTTTLWERFFRRFRLISHLVPPVLSVVAVVIIQKTPVYAVQYSRIEDTYRSWKPLVESVRGYHDWILPGLGCIFLIAGIILYLGSEGLNYLINTLNEDD